MTNPFKSVFNGITKAVKSTCAWLEKELALLEGAAPTIERVIDAGLAYVGPVLQLVLTSIGASAASTIVADVIAQAQIDLKAASALVTDFGPTPTAASIFASVEKNLQALLAAGHIVDTTTVATINKAIAEIGVLAAAIEAAVAGIDAAAKPAPTA